MLRLDRKPVPNRVSFRPTVRCSWWGIRQNGSMMGIKGLTPGEYFLLHEADGRAPLSEIVAVWMDNGDQSPSLEEAALILADALVSLVGNTWLKCAASPHGRWPGIKAFLSTSTRWLTRAALSNIGCPAVALPD
jgi:hypothetical protein